MIFSGVRLPEEVSIALEEGRLVIFAGAGISVSPPSNLPLFNGLASRICSGKAVAPGHEDRVLGRLAREGTDVHAAAARILYNKDTRPTQLHGEILRLFGAPEKVRVVTTNFDDHFSATSRRIFGKEHLREFYAPALPLGDDFAGLAYIHGSARFDPRTLILTDKDFGAAYLTRGWARDFLVPLFSKYTVLFIGYSHSDVTTTYLARGLNQAEIKPRWTMVSSDIEPEGRENWAHLEISVVEYSVDPTNALNRHQALTDFFAQWADHTKEPILTRGKRVRMIARGLPPESATVSEYITYCLNHPRLAQEFCDAIRHPAWIGWMHDQGYFKPLFENTAAPSEAKGSPQWVLAHWLCSYVRRRYPDRLLDLIQTNQRLSRGFTQTLAHVLWVEHSKKTDPRFAVWVSILLAQGRHAVREDIWAYLLTKCQLPEHLGVALRVFELLTTPEIHVDKNWDFSSFTSAAKDASKPAQNKVDYSIQWPGESRHWLSKAWIDVFKPRLPEIAEPLVQVIVRQLTHAYLLLHGVGRSSERYDRLSWSRSSIAPHEQDDLRPDECFSCLVDILREILSHWIATDPQRARMQAEVWWSTKLPLFRRFAAYARSVDPQYGADERLNWVVAHDLVFRSGMKKEVFDIMAIAYPSASANSRRRLLRRIERGDRTSGYKKLGGRTLAYEKFNVLVWLRRSDPQCALIQAAIAKIHTVYPEFVERDYPEFDVWRGGAGFIDPKEGVNFDRILAELPEQYLGSIRKGAEDSTSRARRDYFSIFSELFSRNQDWGRQFTESLALEPDIDAQLWSDVFSAWRERITSDSDWNWILTVIERLPREKAIYAGVANLICHGIWKEEVALSETTIDRAASLIDQAWVLCSMDGEAPDESYRDWLGSAINHVGGWIGEFWVHYCSNVRHRPDAKWNGIPDPLRLKMLDAINGTSRVKVYARLALTPWIGFLFVWDREFSIAHLLPLLDWRRDPIVAQQTWSVLLNYNRGRFREFESELMPYYRQLADTGMAMLKDATEKSDQFDAHALQSLGHNLAALAMHVIPDPVDSGFFRDFLPLLPDEVRSALADGMQKHLEGMDNKRRVDVWDVWLQRYVDLRLIGVPVALSVSETKHMLEWCLHLGPVFPNAVDRITRMPRKGVFAYGLIEELLKNEALERFPVHACRLAIAALQADEYPGLHESLLTLHEEFKRTINGTAELTSLEELLYLRGWQRK